MPTLKQISLVKTAIQLLVIGLVLVGLFSCSKESTSLNVGEQKISPAISSNVSDRSTAMAIPFDKTVFVPCANNGDGEYVRMLGITNVVYTISWTDHGFTYGYHATTYKVEGTGLTSGQTFRGSGNTEGQVMGAWVNEQWLSTIVDNLRLTGSNISFVVHSTYHITTTPDGNVQVYLKDQNAECK